MHARFLAAALGALLLCGSARADTIFVSGDVSGTWSADEVIVTGHLRVPPGQQLVIEPGVQVRFRDHYLFTVDAGATLLAIGTAAQPIDFDTVDPDRTWGGVRFLSASSASRLERCRFSRGHAQGLLEEGLGGAISCKASSPSVIDCVIEGCQADGTGGAISCRNGSSPTLAGNLLRSNSASYGGGAISCWDGSSPLISGNTFELNEAYLGAAVECRTQCSPTLSGNVLRLNVATGRGGGLYCDNSSDAVVTGNVFEGNEAPEGAAISAWGGSDPVITGNQFLGNHAGWGGGALECWNTCHPVITDNVFRGNTAYQGGAFYFGSGSLPAEFRRNEVTGNSAIQYGGAFYLSGGISMSMDKVTLAGNDAPSGGALYCHVASPTLRNCILWDNGAVPIGHDGTFNPLITFCDVEGGWAGPGNIDADPLFVDAGAGDYHLQAASPCIDAGDPAPAFNDPDGTRADMGCYPFNQPTCQTDLGYGGPGTLELSLCGEALTLPASTAQLVLTGGTPGTPVFLPVGLSFNPTPVLGGTLVPFPWTVLLALPADAQGGLSLAVPGAGGPPLTLYLQAVQVGGGPARFSNALEVLIGT